MLCMGCAGLLIAAVMLMAWCVRYAVYVLEASTSSRLTYFEPPLVSFKYIGVRCVQPQSAAFETSLLAAVCALVWLC